MSSSMIFYVRMEKVRERGNYEGGFELCMYSYVVLSVQKTRIEQELITSAPEMKRGESQKIFISNFEPVRGLIDIQ